MATDRGDRGGAARARTEATDLHRLGRDGELDRRDPAAQLDLLRETTSR